MIKRTLPLLAALIPVVFSLAAGCTVTTTSTSPDAGSSGSSGTSDAGVGEGGGGGGCQFGEPNDVREQAKAVDLGATYAKLCVTKREDVDFYEVTAPVDVTGGVIRADFTNVGNGNLSITVFTVSDNGEVFGHYGTNPGQSQSVWFAAAPGQKYRISVGDFAGFSAEYTYDMKLTYTKSDDAFEPNDTRDQAKPLTKGVAVEGLISTGLKTNKLVDSDIEDYFSIDLVAGKTSVRLENVPDNLNAQWTVYDASGKEITNKYGTNDGASVINEEVALDTAGKYFVRVTYFTPRPPMAGEGALPSNYSKKYKLTVNQ